MAKAYKNLRAKLSPDSQKKAKKKTQKMLKEIALKDLRESHQITQEKMAVLLNVNQPAISKLENRNNLTFFSLDEYLKALGYHLELRAVSKDGRESIALSI